MSRLYDKLETFWSFAVDLSNLSTCRAKKVGAIVVSHDLSDIHAIAYNGPAMGQNNESCRAPATDDRQLARCGCVHAEANAVAKCRRPGFMMSTTMPCPHCAGLIVNGRMISAVVYGDDYWTADGLGVMSTAQVESVRWRDLGRYDDHALKHAFERWQRKDR